ncbi:MAG: DUF3857 domain-containing protein [Acidobacteria bacterium]|nr:DUF3857 domain-containing protein [Acidobacteriota bacterium]
MRSVPCRPASRVSTGTLLLIMALPAMTASYAAEKTELQIVPGAKAMSAEEKALAPDPALGTQHGILLVDETLRDESTGTESNVSRHIRAKIFSNEARSLGDIEIPFNSENGILKKWWGTTILPDGTVLELKQGDLKQQELARTRGDQMAVMKASLPGIVPGSVIDYGYQFQERGFYNTLRVDIQQTSPVIEFRYRWVPCLGLSANYLLSHAENLAIHPVKDQRSVLITAANLPGVLDEPRMPPEQESHASVTFFYRRTSNKPEDFWDLESKRLTRRAQTFTKQKPIEQLVASMNLPAGADLKIRLKAAYDWCSANFRNKTLRTAEEAEADASDEDEKSPPWQTAVDLISAKEGTARQLDYLFFGVARALGAEANLVLATDRTERFFDPRLLSLEQFDWTLVAVRAPGEGDDHLIFVDLGSGLPFGEIPWWLTGSRAFMASPAGYRVVLLHPSDPKKNILQTKATISFNLEEGTAFMSWTIDGAGQQGLTGRWKLRGLGPEDRQKELDSYCGASGDLEVSRAEAPKLHDLRASYHLECEATLMNTSLHPGLGTYSFRFMGPYTEATPRFTAPTRTQKIIFDYPRIETLNLDVKTPEGFVPSGVPPVAQVESPFGKYALFISITPEGYHVERLYALTALVVPSTEYEPLKRFFMDVAKADDTALPFKRTGAP